MSIFFKSRASHRHAGDAHRAKSDWNAAALEYREHLKEHPDDAAIWVQLGHAEKERSDFSQAEAAYRSAVALAPADPDPLLHLAHLLKRQGRSGDAFDAFRRLLRLDASEEVITELRRFARLNNGRPAVAAAGSIVFPVDDLFAALGMFTTLTGIPRVEISVFLAAMAESALDAHFILIDEVDGRPTFLKLLSESVRDILGHVSAGDADPAMLRRAAMEARLTATPIAIEAGSWIVILGVFWGLQNRVDRFLAALRNGARLCLFVHDLIPVTHPEFCDVHLSNAFWRSLAEYLPVVDHVFTNSRYTMRALGDFISQHGGRSVPMEPVPLANATDWATRRPGAWPVQLRGVSRSRYVIYVSTIEGRKNHILVVRAWQRLIEASVNVPDLIFVGRDGWKNAPLADLLAKTGNLGGRVHIASGLSDAEVAALYDGALFSVFTSFVEGWGLPVGESLAHGVPCIASRAAAVPEVGGDLVDYVDPDDLDGTVATLHRMICDDAYRDGRRREIADRFLRRTWADVGRNVVDRLQVLATARGVRREVPIPLLPAGQVLWPAAFMSSPVPVNDYVAAPIGLALAESFYEAEAGGAWMRGVSGQLVLRSTLPPGTPVTLLLSLNAASWAIGRRCSLSFLNTTGPIRSMLLGSGQNLVRLDGRVSMDRMIGIAIDCHGDAPHRDGDTRTFLVGLTALAYCAVEDRAARAAARELIVLG